ncbi:MAG: leucine-rich repeat protein, partial [Oscillospiraceae bacterium]|nr:leucine-rich repeat protein [Oscillospiraceae bacterium]
MKRMKLILLAALLLTCPLAAFPNTVLTAEAGERVSDGTLTFMKYSDHAVVTNCVSSAKIVSIPDTIDGLPLTAIYENAFSGCYDLTEVVIPDGVTSIDTGAFSA